MIVENAFSRRGRRVAAILRRYLKDVRASEKVTWVRLTELAAEESPARLVLVVGGDGSINGTASWMLARDFRCPIGVIPAGTGNNLARGLGIPLDPVSACRVALEGTAVVSLDGVLYRSSCDAQEGDNSRRLLIQAGALGFPAEIAARYDSLRRNTMFRAIVGPTGPYIYRILAVVGIAKERWRERLGDPALKVRCRLAGEVIEEQVLAIFINNEKSLGGNFFPSPRAEIDDGKLDICFVRARTGHSYLRLLTRVARGEHLELDDCVIYRQSAQPVELRLSKACRFLADGDLWVKSDCYRLEVLPRRFEVIVR